MQPGKTTLETGTTAYSGIDCFAISIVADAVFATLIGLSGDAYTAVTFPAGLTIYGNFPAITLTSGSILIYQATG